jgi:hypothetical protein
VSSRDDDAGDPVTKGFCNSKMGEISYDLGGIKTTLNRHDDALFGVLEHGQQKGGLVTILGEVKNIVTEINEDGSKPLREVFQKLDKLESVVKSNGVGHKTRWQTYGILVQALLSAVALILVAVISRK